MNIIFQVIYFLIPGAFANMAPVLVRRWFKSLKYPLDFNCRLNGERFLGEHKTFRGLIFGILAAIFGVFLQVLLYRFSFFKDLSVIDYSTVNILLLGFLIGFGILLGDAVGSFFKRRLHIPPGKEFMPIDQIDSPIFMILFILPLYITGLWFAVLSVIVWFFGHLLINYIGWVLKVKRNKF